VHFVSTGHLRAWPCHPVPELQCALPRRCVRVCMRACPFPSAPAHHNERVTLLLFDNNMQGDTGPPLACPPACALGCVTLGTDVHLGPPALEPVRVLQDDMGLMGCASTVLRGDTVTWRQPSAPHAVGCACLGGGEVLAPPPAIALGPAPLATCAQRGSRAQTLPLSTSAPVDGTALPAQRPAWLVPLVASALPPVWTPQHAPTSARWATHAPRALRSKHRT
jgi:hypothetical protein